LSITVKNISKFYGQQKALDDVSFEVGKGQVIGFLGLNGAGKSTMMKILTCFIPQSSGSANVCGFDVTEDSVEVRRRVGYLPEHNPLYPEMYVKEYLEFVAGIYKIKGNYRARVDEMIALTGLQVEQKKKIGALSKGYRQRVGLAQALLHKPEVLILDEPTSGLDPNQLVEIRSLIKNIGKEKTVLLSTHIMQEVEAICDRVLIIDKGKLITDESTSFLKINPKKQDVIIIEFDKAINKNDLLKLKDIEKIKNIKENIWEISGSENSDIRSSLFKWAVEKNLTVLSLQKKEQKLEDVFQLLTGKSKES
jgi:ABC-2 type transport system ATP-binding protein